MQQWKIINNQIQSQYEIDLVGFSKDSNYPVLENIENVLIYRTALGVGDWVMLERLPFNLKIYYPHVKIYLPSPKLLRETFGSMLQQWSSWGDAAKTVEMVFKNNPHIDGYVDEWNDEIYTDHYRIYDPQNWKTPLVRQMARLYQIDDSKALDTTPILYFNQEETSTGDYILKSLINQPFNFLHLSNRNTKEDEEIIYNYIIQNDLWELPFLYYGDIPKRFEKLRLVNGINLIKSPRMQFYIKSKAQNVVGNQTGATDVICGLTQVHSLHHSTTLEETFRVGNYLPPIKYIERNEYNNIN